MEVGVSLFQDQSQHIDLGIVMLKPKGSDLLQPYLRFRGHSETPYRGRSVIPENSTRIPAQWVGKQLRLEIETKNSTHFEFRAGLAGSTGQEEVRVLGHCRGTDVVPYYSGKLSSSFIPSYCQKASNFTGLLTLARGNFGCLRNNKRKAWRAGI